MNVWNSASLVCACLSLVYLWKTLKCQFFPVQVNNKGKNKMTSLIQVTWLYSFRRNLFSTFCYLDPRKQFSIYLFFVVTWGKNMGCNEITCLWIANITKFCKVFKKWLNEWKEVFSQDWTIAALFSGINEKLLSLLSKRACGLDVRSRTSDPTCACSQPRVGPFKLC